MQTKRGLDAPPATTIFLGGGATTMSTEIDYRIGRLEAEARRERLAGRRDGLRQHIGHALIALGRAVHGLEPDHTRRPALDAG